MSLPDVQTVILTHLKRWATHWLTERSAPYCIRNLDTNKWEKETYCERCVNSIIETLRKSTIPKRGRDWRWHNGWERDTTGDENPGFCDSCGVGLLPDIRIWNPEHVKCLIREMLEYAHFPELWKDNQIFRTESGVNEYINGTWCKVTPYTLGLLVIGLSKGDDDLSMYEVCGFDLSDEDWEHLEKLVKKLLWCEIVNLLTCSSTGDT